MSSCGLMSNGVMKIHPSLGNMKTSKQKNKFTAEIFLKFPKSPLPPFTIQTKVVGKLG